MLLRHNFMTGKSLLFKQIEQNSNFLNLEGRKHKKLLSAIPEKEEIFLLDMKDKNDNILSLTKLENEMVLSIVESDRTNANGYIKKYPEIDGKTFI